MAIKTYKKSTAVTLSTNFKSTEFDCHGSGCCSSTKVDEKLVEYLQKIRDHFDKPVNINSGYRCKTHNTNVGGASQSNHMDGEAADIRISGVTPLEVAQYAEHIGILGIGVYSWGVHVDTRTSKYFWYDGGASNVKTFGGTFKEEEKKEEITTTTKEMYRIRKSWDDTKSQIGAYSNLSNAKNACDKAGKDYFVYNSKGEVIYPEPKVEEEVKLDISKVNTSAANPEEMWNFFKSKGLNDFGIAGLMGNLYAESALRACNLQNTYEKSLGMSDAEYTAAVDAGVYTNFINDKAGYGLAQWTYWSLKEQMYKYFQERGKSIGDLQTQMEFLAHQLSTGYKAVWNTLVNATSVREASDAMLLKFERPADQSEAVQIKRANYGQKYYDLYATKIEEEVKPVVKMKYSAENPPLVCMQTTSTCYKATRKMEVKGILWHSTGANNPTLKRYVQPSDNAPDREKMLEILGVNKYKNDWNHIEHQAGLNAWIGKLADGTITAVQTMPWDYKPWGCGSGSKGSCNNGWIQFEICEDALSNEEYFNAVYKEACELTAYLCHMYNIDPKGTVTVNGVKVPTILCHQDAYKLKMGTNHGDVLHWFPKFNKNMDDVREDVAKLLPTTPNEIPSAPSTNLPLQVNSTVAIKEGAKYYSGENIPSWVQKKQWIVALIAGDKVIINHSADGESAINSPMHKDDLIVISNSNDNLPKPLSVGDAVKLVAGATYSSGGKIPSWLFSSKLYIREIRKNGDYVISTVQTGAVTGVVKPASVIPYTTVTISATFEPYFVTITANALNVRSGPGTNYKINRTISKGGIYTIIEEKKGWGKLKSGAGWICLDGYTKKV